MELPDVIPDAYFTPDAAQPQTPAQSPPPDVIPDGEFKADAAQASSGSPNVIPDDQFTPDEAKFSTPGQQIGTAVEGAVKGFISPAAVTYAENKLSELGVPGLSKEEQTGREEANPWIHGLSEAAGMAGSLATGVGEAGLLSKGIGAVLPAGASIAAKLGSSAIRGALESGLIQGDSEISRSMLGQGDPETPVASALAHMGAAGLFGGVIGGGLAGTGMGLKALAASKTAKAAGETLQDIGARMNVPTEAELANESILSRGLPRLKENAKDILGSAERLDLPVMNGMVSGDRAVQMAEDALLNGPPTMPALKRQGLYNQAYEGAKKVIDDMLPQVDVSKASAGQALQSGITNKIAAEYEPIKSMYSAIREISPNIPLAKEDAPAIAKELLKMPEVTQTPNSPMARFVRSVAENIQNAKTVEDISFQRTALKDMANSTIPGERRMASILGDKLNTWADNAVEKFASSPGAPEGVRDLIPQMKAAKAAYSGFIQDVGRVSEELGKGRVHGPQDAMDFINNLDFEQLTNKLAKKDNSQFRTWFSDKFPQEFSTLQQYQKSSLRQLASKSGEFSPKLFLNKVGSMEPELQKSLFSPEELQKIQDANTYIRSFPPNFNPSGTSHMSAFRAFFEHPMGAMTGNARDLAIQHLIIGKDMSPKVLKALGRSSNDATAAAAVKVAAENAPESMHSVLDYAQRVAAGVKRINTGIENLFLSGSQKAVDAYASDKDKEKISKFIEQGGMNNHLGTPPSPVPEVTKPEGYAMGGPVSRPMTHQAPVTAREDLDHVSAVYPDQGMLLGAAKMRISNYLNSVKPQMAPKLPFDKSVPNKEMDRAYDRALDVAVQPLVVLNHIKDGSLTPDMMKHLTGLYPEVYNHLSRKITERAMQAQHDGEKPSYKTRQAMSLFLGAPLDSTMTQSSIQSIQSIFSKNKPQAQPQQQGKQKKSPNKLEKLSSQLQTPDQSRSMRANKG